MKPSVRAMLLPLALVAFNLVVGLAALASGRLPDPAPSGWWAAGEPVAFAPAWVVALRVPAFMAVVLALLGISLRWDPVLSRDPSRRRGALGPIMVLTLMAGSYFNLKVLGTLAAGETTLGLSPWDCAALGQLFIGMGNYVAKSASNGFWAFRSPWTAVSERVHRRTQRLAGWFLMLGGAGLVGGSFWLSQASRLVLGVGVVGYLLLAWCVAFAASYWFHRQDAAPRRKEA